jgi:hypothetical protein
MAFSSNEWRSTILLQYFLVVRACFQGLGGKKGAQEALVSAQLQLCCTEKEERARFSARGDSGEARALRLQRKKRKS